MKAGLAMAFFLSLYGSIVLYNTYRFLLRLT